MRLFYKCIGADEANQPKNDAGCTVEVVAKMRMPFSDVFALVIREEAKEIVGGMQKPNLLTNLLPASPISRQRRLSLSYINSKLGVWHFPAVSLATFLIVVEESPSYSTTVTGLLEEL